VKSLKSVIKITNFFYKDVGRFISICNILAGDDFNPEVFDPADTDEMLLGITEAMLLWPPDEDKNDSEFCEEIREYIKQMLKVEGILHPFDVLRLAFPADQSVNVDADYADDPEMYSAIYQVQQGKTDETRAIYLDNVSALAQQLSALSLQNGSTEPMVKQLQDIVQKAGLGSSQGEAL
jgi:predicted RND superfamily exporter protein